VTIGGGRVLDAHPLPGIRKAKCLAWLEAIKEASLEEQIVQRVARRRTAGLFHQVLSGETGLTGEELHRIAEPLIREGRLVFVSGEIWLSSEAIESGAEKIVSRLEIETTANGLKRSELKSQVALSAEIFDFLLAQLLREQRLKQRGEVVFSAGTGEQTTNPDTKLLSAIAATYEGSGLAAPSRVEVASHLKLSDGEMHRLMTQLLREKTLIRMGTDDLYIHRTALEGLRLQADRRSFEKICHPSVGVPRSRADHSQRGRPTDCVVAGSVAPLLLKFAVIGRRAFVARTISLRRPF
jgi:selenocysteine-specific elongation factor